LNGEAPQLELAIRNMLANRFKLAVHQVAKEASGYALVAGKGSPKLTPSKAASDRPLLGTSRRRDPDGQIINSS